MIIEYSGEVAWVGGGYLPSEDERQVLSQFTEALPDVPKIIRISNICEYESVASGRFEDADSRDLDCNWVEYYFNVQGETQLPKGV